VSRVAVLTFIGVALAAYLLGSIPTGYLVAKARGVDIRTVGSGNIGATNVFRILGKPAGIFVLLTDALKGFLACMVVARLGASVLETDPQSMMAERIRIAAGVAAILGHNYTSWLRFKGGKGIATSAGVLLALMPWPLLIILAVWLIVFFASKYVSLASILAAAALPFAVRWMHGSDELFGVAALLAALAIYKHKSNIQRLLNGTENRVGGKKAGAPSSSSPS
jgi:glycerol-3-phosphate acyltransferase PlsY